MNNDNFKIAAEIYLKEPYDDNMLIEKLNITRKYFKKYLENSITSEQKEILRTVWQESYEPPIMANYKEMIKIIIPLEISVAHSGYGKENLCKKHNDIYENTYAYIRDILEDNGWDNALQNWPHYDSVETIEEKNFRIFIIRQELEKTIKQFPERKDILLKEFEKFLTN